MVMFVISGIAIHTERIFADSRASNTCSFCGHNNRHSKVSSGKSTDDKCNFCGHSNKRNDHFSRQNNKNGCQFCKHGLENGEYSRQAEEYRSPSSDHNYGDEETENEGRNSRSNTITKNETVKGKYALDLRGVHFYNEKAESSVSENENEYEEDEFSSDIMSEGDDSADFDGQRHHVRSLDDWEEYDDSSYGDESDNYDTNDESDESDAYDEFDEEEEQEEDDFDNGNEETKDEMTDSEAAPVPMEQQPQSAALPTGPIVETNDSLQYPALPQTLQYPALDQQNQLGTMDPNTLANQYPYGQQNIENMNVNMRPNQLLQAGQYGINDMNNNAYWQMGNASMTPQYGNGDMSQQAYASVVNETIEYLRNLGVLDENRVSKMSAGMVDGECIICMRPKFVFQIRGQGMRGVCEDCLRSRDSYGGAFGAGGIKGVLERGVMSLFGGGNDDNRGGGGNNGIRSYGSGGGYDDSGGGYYRNPYNNGEMVGNGTPSPVGTDSLRSIANKLTGTVGGGLGGIFGAGNNIFGNGTNGFTGSGGQQMVMNAAGQLVPIGSDPSAPYGYVKDPITGQMRLATSPEEGLAAGAAAAAAGATTAPGVMNGITTGGGVGAAGQQMVMNAAGQLVPMGSDPSAPYGYVKDPTTGQMRLATSAAEGLAAGTAAASGSTGSGQMVMNAAGQLVPMGSDPSAPYGYVKDPTTGQMRPATSPEEGLAAGAAAGDTTAPGVTNGITGAVATATGAATSAVSTAANAATGAMENVTNTAVGAANTAVNAANKAVKTAANTTSQVANSAAAIKNAAQPLASLAGSVGEFVSSVASGIKSKTSSRDDKSSIDSGNDSSRQTENKQNNNSNSNNQTTRKKKKRKSNTASADGSSGSTSGTQQQSSKKEKKQKDSTASAKDTSGTQQSTKKKKKSSKAT